MSKARDIIIETEKPQNKRSRAVLVDGKMEIRWGRDVRSETDRETFRRKVENWLQRKMVSPEFNLEQTKVRAKPCSMNIGDLFRVYVDERAEGSLETLEKIRYDLDILSKKFKIPYGRINESRARSYKGLSHKKNNISLRLYDLRTLEPLSYQQLLRTAIHELAHNHRQSKAHGKRWKSVESKIVEFAIKEGLLKEEKSESKPCCGAGGDDDIRAFSMENFELYKKELDKILRFGPRPNLAVDGIIVNRSREILLIQRGNLPFKGNYALPGGFVDYNECVEDAVLREIKEETNLDCSIRKLVGVYSKPGRDPRGHMVSVVFSLNIVSGVAKSGDDAVGLKWFPLDGFLPQLAFDHNEIIEDFKKSETKPIPPNPTSLNP